MVKDIGKEKEEQDRASEKEEAMELVVVEACKIESLGGSINSWGSQQEL